MSQQRRGGLGRGLAALIPTGPDEGPRLGSDAADVILGPRGGGPRTTPPRPRSSGSGTSAGSNDPARDANRPPRCDGASEDDVSRETEELVDPGAVYREIPPSAIEPNPKQPRTHFDEEALAELAHSVKEFGLLQPIVVREIGAGRYQLIMGERRWRASQRAELQTVPAIVRQTDDEDLLRDALLENIHRVQLNPLEEAAAYQQLLEEFDVTQAELATRIGRSRPAITNSIRLLQLPTAVQRRVAGGGLCAGPARARGGREAGAPAPGEHAARVVGGGVSGPR
jgi:ParB family chromosome partitioning protein